MLFIISYRKCFLFIASGAVIAPSNKNIPGLIGPFLGAGSPVQAAPTFPVVPAVIAGPSIKSGGPVIFSAPLGGSLLPGAGGSFGAAGSLDLDSDFKYSSIASSSGGPAVFSAPLAAASSLLGAGGPAIFSAPLAAAGSLHGAGDPSVAIGGAGTCFFGVFWGIFWYCFPSYNYRYTVFNLSSFYIYPDMYTRYSLLIYNFLGLIVYISLF